MITAWSTLHFGLLFMLNQAYPVTGEIANFCYRETAERAMKISCPPDGNKNFPEREFAQGWYDAAIVRIDENLTKYPINKKYPVLMPYFTEKVFQRFKGGSFSSGSYLRPPFEPRIGDKVIIWVKPRLRYYLAVTSIGDSHQVVSKPLQLHSVFEVFMPKPLQFQMVYKFEDLYFEKSRKEFHSWKNCIRDTLNRDLEESNFTTLFAEAKTPEKAWALFYYCTQKKNISTQKITDSLKTKFESVYQFYASDCAMLQLSQYWQDSSERVKALKQALGLTQTESDNDVLFKHVFETGSEDLLSTYFKDYFFSEVAKPSEQKNRKFTLQADWIRRSSHKETYEQIVQIAPKYGYKLPER
ncbi:hypothetical protein KIH39_21445 [Telmatocola sphagniphila]|uniref:Uncharacterized protein n=1 Tax=Telmatocola sphagniphila TaxID=1123043 RepID=A0A8E6B6N1_9BACT|nr:hypothetical protein [Telmatocola sphagniphila]QVL31385.1 hypothetical protein KIH39_21445 [Telmatocola sphagniphila]